MDVIGSNESSRAAIPGFRPPAPHHRPGGRKGTSSATPLAILTHLLAGRPLAGRPGACLVCQRRQGSPRRVSPVEPSLAALVPAGAGPMAILCRRCTRSPAVRGLIAAEDCEA